MIESFWNWSYLAWCNRYNAFVVYCYPSTNYFANLTLWLQWAVIIEIGIVAGLGLALLNKRMREELTETIDKAKSRRKND